MQVKLLFEENNVLDEENKRLLRKYQKERSHHSSSGKHTGTASAKVRKRGITCTIFFYLKKKKPVWCFESLLVLFLVSALMFYMTSLQSNKRKSSPKISSPVEKKLDFNDVDLARHPLSPLRNNSPDSKMHKF